MQALEAGLASVAPGVDARLRTIVAGFTSSALAAAIEDKTRRTQVCRLIDRLIDVGV